MKTNDKEMEALAKVLVTHHKWPYPPPTVDPAQAFGGISGSPHWRQPVGYFQGMDWYHPGKQWLPYLADAGTHGVIIKMIRATGVAMLIQSFDDVKTGVTLGKTLLAAWSQSE